MWMRLLPIKFPHVWMQIDIAMSTALATDPSFAASPDYDNVPASVMVDLGTSSAQMEAEPLVLTAPSIDFTMSNEGGYAALLFTTSAKRIALRYRLSFDSGSTYEEAFWGEIDFASIQRKRHQSNVSGVLDYEFTVFDKVKSLLEKKNTLDIIGEVFTNPLTTEEDIVTLYNQSGYDISSILTGTNKVIELQEFIERIASQLGASAVTFQTPFNAEFGIGTFNLSSVYIFASTTQGVFGMLFEQLEDLLEIKNRSEYTQYSSVKDLLRYICYTFGVYPQTYWGGASGWSGTLEMIARTYASPITFAASAKYLSETSTPHASKPISWRVTYKGGGESSGGLGASELTMECEYLTLDNRTDTAAYKDWFNTVKGQMLYFRSAANTYYIPNRIYTNMPNGADVRCESTTTYPNGSTFGLVSAMGIHYAGEGTTDATRCGTVATNFGIWGKEREVLRIEINTIVDSSGSFTAVRPNREYVYDGVTYWITGVEKNIQENKTELTLLNMS